MKTVTDQSGSPQHAHGEGANRGIAEAVQNLRKSLGLTQAQLAEKLAVRPNSVSRYELGTIKPSPQILLLLLAVARSHHKQRMFADLLFKSGIQLAVTDTASIFPVPSSPDQNSMPVNTTSTDRRMI